MRPWTTFLLSFALALPASAMSCSSDPGTSSSSSSGDDDDNASSSGNTSSSGNGSSSGQQVSENVVTTDETMVFGGNTRHYLLSKPKDFDANKKYPLVLNLHGNPSSAQAEKDAMPFDTVTKQEAVIVYPTAANGSDWDFTPSQDDNPDMAWIKPLIDELANKASIDPSRVLAFGYSGGAYFLSQFACRVDNVASIVKMIAIISGGAPEPKASEPKDQCVACTGGAVPMLIAHGMTDASEVPFEGGDYARVCWAQTNGCTEDSLSDADAPCKTYNGCNQPLSWCPVPDHGHEPWGEGMKHAWDMFKALP